MKKIKDIKKLRLRHEVIRILTSAELKIVIGGVEGEGGDRDDGSNQSKIEGATGC